LSSKEENLKIYTMAESKERIFGMESS